MDKNYVCYCGLYCGNCAVKVKVEPTSKALYEEMKKAGFEAIMPFLPDGDKFWSFLKGMAVEGVCISCKAGSGNPNCQVRLCAKENNVEMCALCEKYPCERFSEFFIGYPVLKHDNAVLSEQGWEAWSKLQDQRKANSFTYNQ